MSKNTKKPAQNQEDFFAGITINGKPLTDDQAIEFCERLVHDLYISKELAKIHFNTQVYNTITNDVTTRGGHSVGVAIVAGVLAEKQMKAKNMSPKKQKIAELLSIAIGYMHDLGHTPFGHDGEAALNTEMERFGASDDYKAKRTELFGSEYTESADKSATTMCYEHNETSAVIASNFLREFAAKHGYEIDEKTAMPYIVTGILAHSTSRVQNEPNGVEQKSVRLADKVAYIPQDLLDLLKQGVMNVNELQPEELALIGLAPMEGVDYENGVRTFDSEKADKLKNDLANIDKLSPQQRDILFKQLDSLVKGTQKQIASMCVKENGELKGFKEEFDKLSKFAAGADKYRVSENTSVSQNGETYEMAGGDREFAYIDKKTKQKVVPEGNELEGAILIRKLDDAVIKYDQAIFDKADEKTLNEAKQTLDQATTKLKDFLVKEYGMPKTIATLWITKHKYQDAFIDNKIRRHGYINDKSTLGKINNRDAEGWKMKTMFQLFYSNPDAIPESFKKKYPESKFTRQQMVSAYIASFTNEGLDNLYKKFSEPGKNGEPKAIITREETITQISAMLSTGRKGIDEAQVKSLLTIARNNLKKREKPIKISENEMLEIIYEMVVKKPIVSGKKPGDIPYTKNQIEALKEFLNMPELADYNAKSGKDPELLSSTIINSTEKISASQIKAVAASVKGTQTKKQINSHIKEAESEMK